MNLHFVFFIVVVYTATKIGEKLLGTIGVVLFAKMEEYVVALIGEYVVAPIGEYVVAPIGEYLVSPIGRQLGYLLFYNSNIKNFLMQIENLKKARSVVQRLVDVAEMNGEVIQPRVLTWLKSVNEIIEKSMNIFGDELQVNLKLRYQRSRNAQKMTADVDYLVREGNSFDRISTFTKAAEVFESRKFILKKIMEALKDNQIDMIGIYGMGGVGKTTLAKEVAKQAKDDNLFEEIVMAVVSQTPNFARLQGEIADMLGLKFDVEGISRRAQQLSRRLEETKRILVILDDIWERIELEDIGIPFGGKNKGCKIVLTSRSQQVCLQMNAYKNFWIDVLSEREGWNLFRKTVGDSVESPDLYPLAVEVAKECAGLPIAIVTIAKALKNKGLSDWRSACKNLRKSNPDDRVISTLELSYNNLESEEAKSFFLLCCLFPEDSNIAIQDLMKYGMGLGLFQDVDTMDEARERAHALAESLISSCLLRHGWSEEHVKMHDLVRDVAISMAHEFLVRVGQGWKKFPVKDQYKRYTAISLCSNDFHELPDELECPKLQILLLEFPHPSLQFPDNFFLRMENLKVLDMSGMHFLSLPPSLRYLKNLRTLCLDRCILKDISIIGELEKLEILSFLCSDIEELPKEIGILTELRLLDLSECKNLTVIPPDVILGLIQLEGLYMWGSFDKWEIERQDKERSNASLAELKHLSRLVNLEIQIPDAELLPEDLLFKNLSRFKISIGNSFGQWDQFSYSKILKLELNLSIVLKNGVKGLLKKAEHLHLKKMNDLTTVVSDLDEEGFQDLRCLNVEQCCEVEYIFNAPEWVSLVAFPIMEKLVLNDLPKLKQLWHGQLPKGIFSELQELRLCKLPGLINMWKDPAQNICFHKLTVVEVEDCDGLKNLFSHCIAKDLSRLVKLKVRRCEIMEEIVGTEKEEATAAAAVDDIVFPHLRSLMLNDLPNLKNFCSKMKSLALKGDLDTCTEQPLFDKKVAFPGLEKLIIEGDLRSFNFREIWYPQLPVNSFSQLKVLRVERCHKVSKVVPFNFLQRLQSLEELSVKDCDSVEEVVEDEGLVIEEEYVTETLFHVIKLRLWRLPKLEHIICWDKYPHRTIGFRNLSSIDIYKCNSLKTLFSPSIASSLVQLQEVEIDSCKMMETIIANEREGEENCMEMVVFPQLHTLKLENLPKLVSFMKMFTSMFSIQQKHMIEDEIFKEAPQEGNNLHDLIQPLFSKKVLFPALEILRIDGIGNLMEIQLLQLFAGSFSQLKVLNVECCHKVSKVVPFNLLWSLEELNVEDCDSLEEVVEVEVEVEVEGLVLEEGHVIETLYQLRELRLWRLPKLKHMMRCDKYPHRTLGFRNLSSIDIYECNSMKSLFSPFMVSSLVQLDEVEIDSCKMMESIIAEEREGEEICKEIIVFPQLRTLKLLHLPKLICFMKTFTSIFSTQQKHMINDEIVKEVPQEGNLRDPIQPLFDQRVTLPTIEVLIIKGLDNLKDIWHPQLKAESFCQLKVLEMESCHKISNVIPSNLLKCLTNLKEVSVEECDSVEIIFEVERLAGEDRRGAITLSQLKKLSLSGLPKLFTSKHPNLQKFQMDDEEFKEKPVESDSCITIRPLFDEWVAFTNLEVLRIINIENLQEIFHSQLPRESLSQLRFLHVKKCHKLSRVAPSNLLPRLKNFKELVVEECNSMENIFGFEGKEHTAISLFQLEKVELRDLPNLMIFCSGNYNFELPALKTLSLEQCPKMQTFSSGFMSTPKLETVEVEDYKKAWKGDLNSTVYHLFQEKVTLPT